MAEELLGVGFDIHGGGNDLDLPPSRERGRADARGARRASSRRSGCTTGCSSSAARRWPRASATSRSLADALERWGRDALVLFFCSGHYRQPIQYSDETMRAGAGRRAAPPRGRRGCWRRARRRRTWRPLRERFFAALADDFNTAEALAAVWDWVRESNRRGGVGDADLREMLGVLGLDNLLDAAAADGEPDAAARELLERRERRARRARLRRGRSAARRAGRASGWQVRDSPARARARARRAVSGGRRRRRARPPGPLRPQRGPRGPARRAGASTACGRPRGAAREPWLAGGRDVPVDDRRRRRDRPPRGQRRPPGRLRARPTRTRTPTRPRCWPPAAADRRPRRGPGPAEPRRRSCRTAEARRRRRRGDLRAPRRRGHRRRGQGLGRGGRAPAGRAGAQPGRLPRRGQGRPAAGATERPPTAPSPTSEPDYRGSRRARPRRRGTGLRPRVAALCDALVALPMRGRLALAERQRRGGRAAVRDLASRASA